MVSRMQQHETGGNDMLSLERAAELNATMVSDEHLIIHAKNVSYAMGAMAAHFG